MCAKKRKASVGDIPGRRSSASERVVWLLNAIWKGNRSEMGRSVGCSHTVLAKIVGGQQGPGRRLLASIAEHPKVNPGWLLSGAGEPLLASGSMSAEGVMLPIAQRPLPGHPDRHREYLSGQSFPVPSAYYRDSRYWLAIERGARMLNDLRESFEVGDLLLMETSPEWCQQFNQVNGRLCIIRMASKALPPELARVHFVSEAPDGPDYWEADPFEHMLRSGPATERFVIECTPGRHPTVRQQTVLPSSGKGRASERRSSKDAASQPYSIKLEQIVGVCVLLVRQYA
jgi:hypothetical protein